MNYQQLLTQLQTLTPEQLAQDVTVYISEQDEYYALRPDYPTCTSETDDVLDGDHFYLAI